MYINIIYICILYIYTYIINYLFIYLSIYRNWIERKSTGNPETLLFCHEYCCFLLNCSLDPTDVSRNQREITSKL